jgi:excisionase family DNA binding protein
MTLMPKEPSRVDRLVAMLSDEYLREVATRSGALQGKKPRPEPPPYVDLEQYANLSNEEVARALGFEGEYVDYMGESVAENRAGLYDKGDAPGLARCEAGVKEWGLLRCHRRAIAGERWCRQHHPAAPPSVPAAARLSPWDLAARPDGALLQAVYDLSDQQADLARLVASVLNRLDRAEQRHDEAGPELLTVRQAAELLGVGTRTVYKMCKEHRIPWLRVGGQIRFRAKDLDAWLADRTMQPARRGRR